MRIQKWKIWLAFFGSLLFLSTVLTSCKDMPVSGENQTTGAKELKGEDTMKTPDSKKINLTEEEWKSKLSPQEYNVARQKGTERAFTGEYWNTKTPGIYTCVGCGEELFSSNAKFDSGTGWPSFWEPINDNCIRYNEDDSLLMSRVEVVCEKCGSHLGHVFDDGPKPTGKRYCINSVSLKLIPEKQSDSK